MTKQIYHTTNWPQIVFAGAVQHTKECPRVKMGSVSPSCTNPSLVPSARAQDIRVSGLKEYRWSLAWVEQSHLSNLSILYGERSEPCTRVSFRVLLLCDLRPLSPPPPPNSNGELARWLSSLNNETQWSQEWILSFLIHETGLIEKPTYQRNLNRELLVNLRQSCWR